MKKLLSVLLTIVLLISVVPLGAFSITASAENVTSGTTGDCTWSLDGTVLTISGKGAMEDYTYSSNSPWGTDITEVVIEKGVTKVGNYAFYTCRSLTSAILSDGVTLIGDSSFAYCTSLKSITIPNSIKSFGDSAFNRCFSLLGIVIPDGVTSIGNQTFEFCGFKDIIIPNSVKTIGESAFLGCSFKSIVIPDSVTSIGKGIFGYCYSLTSIVVDENNATYYSANNCIMRKTTNVLVAGCKASVIPNGVTSIGEDAFNGLDFINFTIPDGVTRIGGFAFAGCDFTSITIPKSITDIAYGAFYLCDKLTDVYYSGNRVDKSKINIGGSNEKLTNAHWHYSPCENDAHMYNYDCSTTCINCDYIREANITHIYDSDCDEKCKVCNETREPKHIFAKSGENIATCEICKLSKTFDFIITTDESITLSYEASKEFDFEIENTSIAKISNVSSSIISMGSYYRQISSANVVPVYPGETTVKVVATGETVLATSSLLVVEGNHQMEISQILKEVSCTESGEELHICKFCGFQENVIIESLGHSYDNACDSECNICKVTRTVPDHIYDDKYDADCNECGAVREVPPRDWLLSVNFTGVYNITPSKTLSGFNKDSITVLDKNGKAVKYNDAKQGWPLVAGQGYTVKLNADFDNINNLTWNLTKKANTIFTDTLTAEQGGWYNDAVTYSVGAGLITGYGGTTKFGTADNIQRQDFVVILARLAGVDLENYQSSRASFTDVPSGAYYEKAIMWAADCGITTGYAGGTEFGVGDVITREQLVTFLYRYAKYINGGAAPTVSAGAERKAKTYADYKGVTDYAKEAIIWALDKSVISGQGGTRIAPAGNALRCEVAQIMYNIFLNNIF